MKPYSIAILFFIIFLLLLSLSSSFADRIPLAVYDLEAQGVPGATAAIVTDVVRSELRFCGKYELIEKARMQEVLRLQGFQQTGCTEAECAAKLGKILNVKKMVVGGLGKLGESYRLSLRVVDVETAVIETEGSEKQALKEDDLDRLVPVLVSRLFCPEIKRPEITPPPALPESAKGKPVYKEITIPIVGERMSVAVLPFECFGGPADLGQRFADKLANQIQFLHRFAVVEPSQVEKVLKEQALGMSGVVDVASATKVGKVLGVDAVLIGSITQDEKKVGVDVRLLNTETAVILTSTDAYGKSGDPEELRKMATKVAVAIYNASPLAQGMPLAQGTVIKVETSGSIMVDLGEDRGLKKGMKLVVFKEGEVIKHPVTGEVLGYKSTKLGELIMKDVQAKFGIGEIVGKKEGTIEVGDKVIVK